MREKLIELFTNSHISLMFGSDSLGDRRISELNASKLADYLIANGVTIATDNNVGDKWIPVSERLPELWQDCFVLVKMKYDWETDYERNVDMGCYVGEHGYIDCFNTNNDWNEGQQYIHITHWMPLPEPPKGE